MAAIDPARYEELCRLCAAKTTMLLGIHIFQTDGMVGQLRKKIESCLPIHVHESDQLPKMVCETCLYKLNLLSDFRDRTVRTERLLLNLIKDVGKVHQPLSVVQMDHNDLLMVQQQQLLTNHDMANVDEIDYSQLGNREQQMIVGHEIILTHQALESIDLNHHHELAGQDISNHSLHNNNNTDDQFAGNEGIDLLHHQQLLNDQFRLPHEHHEMHVLQENLTDHRKVDIGSEMHATYHMGHQEDDKKLELDYTGNIELNNLQVKIDNMKGEDSNNSNHSLLIDEHRLELGRNVEVKPSVYAVRTTVEETSGGTAATTREWTYCNICGKSFDEAAFGSHYESHFHRCDVCQAVFTTDDVLTSHRKEAHPEPSSIKKDDDSNSEESSSGEYVEDDDVEEDDEDEEEEEEVVVSTRNKTKRDKSNDGGKAKVWSPKVCTECGKTYKTNYKLNEHMRKHTGEKPYKCDSCDKEFRSKIGLAQHAAKHTGKYDYACPTCGKGFQCKSYLMVHQRVHSDVKPYPCTTCGRNFKTKQSLLDHTNRHLGVKPYICETCGRGFITKGLCKAHQKVHTGLDNRKYSCKVCQKMFVSKSYLQTHLRIHTGEKPFICEVCGKGFLTKVDLRIHTTMHTGEKSYVCEMCGKAFARRDALRCHRRSHTGERPYSCDVCGQTFTQFTPMAIHKRLHTGERPYACESCGKTFVSRSTMMSHAKKHLR